MSRQGFPQSLLESGDLHAIGCDGQEYSSCRPVINPVADQPDDELVVVYMEWCGECGAADWEFV